MDRDELEAFVHQSIGQASMCWSARPQGVFDTTMAVYIGQELMAAIKKHAETEIKKDRAIQHLAHPFEIKDKDGNVIAIAKGDIGKGAAER